MMMSDGTKVWISWGSFHLWTCEGYPGYLSLLILTVSRTWTALVTRTLPLSYWCFDEVRKIKILLMVVRPGLEPVTARSHSLYTIPKTQRKDRAPAWLNCSDAVGFMHVKHSYTKATVYHFPRDVIYYGENAPDIPCHCRPLTTATKRWRQFAESAFNRRWRCCTVVYDHWQMTPMAFYASFHRWLWLIKRPATTVEHLPSLSSTLGGKKREPYCTITLHYIKLWFSWQLVQPLGANPDVVQFTNINCIWSHRQILVIRISWRMRKVWTRNKTPPTLA